MNPFIDNIAAIFFVIVLFIQGLWATRLSVNNWTITLVPILLHIGILAGGLMAHDPTKIFWGFDSTSYHIPHSVNAFNDVTNLINFKAKSYSESLLITHLITGVFFKIFGVNVVATTISTLMIKIPTCFMICKLGERFFNLKIGKSAAIIFALYPSVIVFDAIFFKEISVQFFLVTFFILLYDYSFQKKSFLLIPLFLILLFIANERSYLLPSLFGAFFLATIYFIQDYSTKIKILAMLLVGLIFAFFVYYFSANYPPTRIIQRAIEVRNAYKSINSVDTKWNYDIPYFLAIIKIIFTPFFTFSKFKNYFNLTSLIVWSVPINQFVILLSLFGMKNSLGKYKYQYPIILSFFIYILLLAYFRPYDGRVRDSYIPIIIIYALAAFNMIIEKLKLAQVK
jgi:hypothetical protein